MSAVEQPGQALARPGGKPAQAAKTAPCSCGCPNGTDVRGWIGIIAQRRKTKLSLDEAYTQAWNIIAAVNPFPSVMGRVCPHPCQEGCSRGPKDGAVEIRALERFIGDKGLEMGLPLPHLDRASKVASIGVIGSGPAGLSCAYQLARRGHEVTVYDKAPLPGGMLRYGIPDYRLPPAILDAEIDRIRALGVEIQTNTAVGKDLPVEVVYNRHQAVFVGIGAQLGRPLGIPGEEGPGVWGGTDYLRYVNEGESVDMGRSVIVVGGGNTAVDACRTARRGGAEVVLLYRRTRSEMPAYDDEVEAMLDEGVRIEFLAAPIEVERDDTGVTGLLVQRMVLGEADASGRRRPTPVEGDRFSVAANSVIVAVAQEPDWRRLEAIHPDGGWIDAGEDGSISGNVWVGGDVQGPGFASLAITHGRMAAEGMHARLCGLESPTPNLPPDEGPLPVKGDLYPTREAPKAPILATAEALADPGAEVTGTLGEEDFLREVESCFSCGLCFGCEHCWMYCSAAGFARLEEPRPGAYFTLALDACESCGKCVDVCPSGYLEFDPLAIPTECPGIGPQEQVNTAGD